MKKFIHPIFGSLIFLLLFSACSFRQIQNKRLDLNESLIGWWERYYPDGRESRKSSSLTHIEFMDDRECRYNIAYKYGNDNGTSTINNTKWKVDSLNRSKVFMLPPNGLGEDFIISVLEINQNSLKVVVTFSNDIDTIFMKKLPKLH